MAFGISVPVMFRHTVTRFMVDQPLKRLLGTALIGQRLSKPSAHQLGENLVATLWCDIGGHENLAGRYLLATLSSGDGKGRPGQFGECLFRAGDIFQTKGVIHDG